MVPDLKLDASQLLHHTIRSKSNLFLKDQLFDDTVEWSFGSKFDSIPFAEGAHTYMTQPINYHALNEFLNNQTDDISSIYIWYERLSEYDLEGTESPEELETIFQAVKFLMSFSFTAAEELREVAEREAATMADKEEAWEEQKIALKDEIDTLRERITVSADAGDSTEAFRAQINSLREENRELEKTNRDRDREMADLRDRFESLVSRADILARERDALEQHKNQMEDTVRELQRRISAKSEETTNEWESRKLRQRNEQAVTLTRQMQAVILQNDELRDEVVRVGDALEEATRIINESSARYAELTAQHDAAQRELRVLSEENVIMRGKLNASTSMLANVETAAVDAEQSTAAKVCELTEVNTQLREELYATKRELDELRRLANSKNHEGKEAELEKLRGELIEATKTARSLYGEITAKTSTNPTVALQLRIMQLESHLKQSKDKMATQEKTLEELEDTLIIRDKLHADVAAEVERLRELKFGDAREELKRLMTQLAFREEQIARLTSHCTLLQIELGAYAKRTLKAPSASRPLESRTEQTQTNVVCPDVVPQSDAHLPQQALEKKPRSPSNLRRSKEVKLEQGEREHQAETLARRMFDSSLWEQQAALMVSLYSELMQIMEEHEEKQKQIAEMEKVLHRSQHAMDNAKSLLHSAFEEIYRLKQAENTSVDAEVEEDVVELLELRRLAATIKIGGSEVERLAEEITGKLITEQVERARLLRKNAVLRRRNNRAEQLIRRAREKMIAVETQAGKRCAQLQYQLDTALIDLVDCQNKLVRSVSIETYEKLALRFKKECLAEMLGSENEETWKDSVVLIASPTDAKTQELEAKNAYLKKIVEVISEQNDFWSKETEILQNENAELKRFVEDMENESDLKNILASIEQRLLETIREQQEGRRDHERAYRKAREIEEKLAHERSEWFAQRSRLVFALRTLQTALLNTRLKSLYGLSPVQIDELKTKIQDVKENEMVMEDAKEEVEAMRKELQRKVAVQRASLKAKGSAVKDTADELKLEEKLQTIYCSLEQQTVKAKRLETKVMLKDRQLEDLRRELIALERENEDLISTLIGANLCINCAKDVDVVEHQEGPNIEETDSTVEERRRSSPFPEESQSYTEDSEATSADSERDGVKTILQENYSEFEKRLVRVKETAELCIQGYKRQLLQKDQALEMYRQLAEEKLPTMTQSRIEKEIVKKEVYLVDEHTEERLRHALGDVARLKEEIEELEKANRALYKKRRSVVPAVNAAECQTDAITEDEDKSKEIHQKPKPSSGNSSADSAVSSNESKMATERQRHKNEIKQLQAKLRRSEANNRELIKACEKIREDAVAELAMRMPNSRETDDQTIIRIRTEYEKTRKENRSLRKIIEEQRNSMESINKESHQKKRGEEEMSRWNERKKLEDALANVRKKLADSLEREKRVREKLGKRDRLLAELTRNEESRRKELEWARKKQEELQYERDKAVSENVEVQDLQNTLRTLIEEKDKAIKESGEVPVLKKKLVEEALKLEQNEKDISALSLQLKTLQRENAQLLQIIGEVKAKQIERSLAQDSHTTSPQSTHPKTANWKNIEVKNLSKTTQTSYTSPVALHETFKKENRKKDVAVGAKIQNREPAAVVTDAAIIQTIKEKKKKPRKMDEMHDLLNEVTEKWKICEKERQRLMDTNKSLVEEIECREFGSLGALNALVEKLQTKDREIIQLRSQVIGLAQLPR